MIIDYNHDSYCDYCSKQQRRHQQELAKDCESFKMGSRRSIFEMLKYMLSSPRSIPFLPIPPPAFPSSWQERRWREPRRRSSRWTWSGPHRTGQWQRSGTQCSPGDDGDVDDDGDAGDAGDDINDDDGDIDDGDDDHDIDVDDDYMKTILLTVCTRTFSSSSQRPSRASVMSPLTATTRLRA